MTQDIEGLKPHKVIAERVKALRRAHSWSGQQFGEVLTAHGIPWDRSIVANFESGRRAYVTVEEFLTLAYVLDVAPAYLLLPIDDEAAPIAVTDRQVWPVWRVREWFRGRMHLPGQARRIYHSQVPETEFVYPPKPVMSSLATTKVMPDPGVDDGAPAG